MAMIARPSVASLLLSMRVNDESLATGTGFVVNYNDHPYLITNRHNLSGRRTDTNEPLHASAATPDFVRIMHNSSLGPGNWCSRDEPLIGTNGEPLWLEHPRLGRHVDVVALQLRNLNEVELYPYSMDSQDSEVADPAVSEGVSIVGFPFGLTGGGVFGIWSRGFVATEPDVDFNDLPLFLIDSRTRPGQSGSPVIVYFNGGMVPTKGGGSGIFGHPVEKLLGVYSGRINAQSDLGFVWKASVIADILAQEPQRL
ncbi:trypsin-like peptidase domain-containing protein [Micromonospora profundi]|uniref:trypsin-like peptidase domain-containing protein n=1 Tax=Micromonospora profundi TaxID=1420889 RepID=UPI002FEF2F95